MFLMGSKEVFFIQLGLVLIELREVFIRKRGNREGFCGTWIEVG